MVAIVDSEGIFRYASPSAEALLGRRPDDHAGLPLVAHVHPEDEPIVRGAIESACASSKTNLTTAFRVQRRGGEWSHVDATWRNLLDEPGIGGIVLNARDVTERKVLEDQLAYRAYHDPLTDLPNRALLADRLEQALARGSRGLGRSALLFVDLDNFKAINDTLRPRAR